VRHRAVQLITEIDDASTLRSLFAFRDASYFLTRQLIAKHLAVRFRDSTLDEEDRQLASDIVAYCINDGESRAGTLKLLRLLRRLLDGSISYAEYEASWRPAVDD
jgi:hypothetical protein